MMVRAAMLGNKTVTPMEAMKKIMMNKNYKAASEKFKTALNKQFGTL